MELQGKILTFGLCLLIWGYVEARDNFSCFDDTCHVNVSFCELQKQVCRRCIDFREFCWTNNNIPNCTVFCLENVPPPGYIKENKQIGLGNNSSNQDIDHCNKSNTSRVNILIAAACLLFVASICLNVLMYWKWKLKGEVTIKEAFFGTSKMEILKNKEETVPLNIHTDHKGLEQIVLTDQTKAFVPPSQITSTNDRNDDPKCVVSGKTSDFSMPNRC